MDLILIYGPPAAGKLTVAQALSNLTGHPLLDNHRATDYISELFPRANPAYTQIRAALGRKIRLDIFAAAASANISLIATFAPLAHHAHTFIDEVISVVEKERGTVCLVQLLPEKEALLERVVSASRKGKKIDTIERWQAVADESSELFKTFEGRPHWVIDNTLLTPLETAQRIRDHYDL